MIYLIAGCIMAAVIIILVMMNYECEDPKWKEIHEILGCKGCEFATKRKINRNACCTYTQASMDSETGKCVMSKQ